MVLENPSHHTADRLDTHKECSFVGGTQQGIVAPHPDTGYDQESTSHDGEQNGEVSPEDTVTPSYLGESGFLHIFGAGQGQARSLEKRTDPSFFRDYVHIHKALDLPPRALQQSFTETYFEYCYAWCPVIDAEMLEKSSPLSQSPLLRQALALVGSQICPPVINHATPAEYYARAKVLFNGNGEKNPVVCIISIILFYWWGYGAPTTFTMDTVFWWTGIAIRLGQQIGLHREPKKPNVAHGFADAGLRRRIWWTLFARERLTAISQGRPCTIDLEDCTIPMPALSDFPQPVDQRGHIFIHWVHLCATIGRVAKHLQRTSGIQSQFPRELASELVAWVNNLPPSLQLPIQSDYTTKFDRDVYQLHLPYLSTIILLHLRQSTEPLPTAYTTAIVAATCVARILDDLMARGHIRYLPAVIGWYVAVALLALLSSRKVECLALHAENDIKILRTALKELAKMWQSSKMIDQGLDRILSNNPSPVHLPRDSNVPPQPSAALSNLAAPMADYDFDIREYLPYVNVHTSPLAEVLVNCIQDSVFDGLEWPEDLMTQLQDLGDDSFLHLTPF